ncbi:hypothetical protein DFJ73DRAFT_867796, partial [Zopfochytrium polystomum]
HHHQHQQYHHHHPRARPLSPPAWSSSPSHAGTDDEDSDGEIVFQPRVRVRGPPPSSPVLPARSPSPSASASPSPSPATPSPTNDHHHHHPYSDDDEATLHTPEEDLSHHPHDHAAATSSPSSSNLHAQSAAASSSSGLLRDHLAKRRLGPVSITVFGNKTVFLPSEAVEGVVSFEVFAPVALYNVIASVKGFVHTSLFKDNHEKEIEEESVYACSTDVFFKDLISLLPYRTGQAHNLEPGNHHYPFRFRMPAQRLPASFEGKYGRVEYRLEAHVHPKHLPTRSAFLRLTVPSTLNAADVTYSLEQTTTSSSYDNVWPWKTGRVEVTLTAPRAAFNPEEVIPVTIEIHNHSASNVVIDEIALHQTSKYQAVSEVRGPYSRIFKRTINVRIPSTSLFSPDISSSLIVVNHLIVVKVSANPSDKAPQPPTWAKMYHKYAVHRHPPLVEATLPFVIGGFPTDLVNGDGETLPRYTADGEANEDSLPEAVVYAAAVTEAAAAAEDGHTDETAAAAADFEWEDGHHVHHYRHAAAASSSLSLASLRSAASSSAASDIDYDLLYGPSADALLMDRRIVERKHSGVALCALNP